MLFPFQTPLKIYKKEPLTQNPVKDIVEIILVQSLRKDRFLFCVFATNHGFLYSIVFTVDFWKIGGLNDFSDRFLRPSYPSTLNVVYTDFLIEWKSAESSKHNVWTHYNKL